MIDYKQIVPCIYLKDGMPVKDFADDTELSESAVDIALSYSNLGADAVVIFDLSSDDQSHETYRRYQKTDLCRVP